MKLPSLLTSIPTPWKIGAGLLLILIVVLAFKSCTATTNHRTDATIKVAKESGGATARAAAAEEGVKDVVKSQAARAAVDRDAAARYDVCLRTSRTPKACRPPA